MKLAGFATGTGVTQEHFGHVGTVFDLTLDAAGGHEAAQRQGPPVTQWGGSPRKRPAVSANANSISASAEQQDDATPATGNRQLNSFRSFVPPIRPNGACCQHAHAADTDRT